VVGNPFGQGSALGLLGALGGLSQAGCGRMHSSLELGQLQRMQLAGFGSIPDKKEKEKEKEKTVIQELQAETDEWLKDIE